MLHLLSGLLWNPFWDPIGESRLHSRLGGILESITNGLVLPVEMQNRLEADLE